MRFKSDWSEQIQRKIHDVQNKFRGKLHNIQNEYREKIIMFMRNSEFYYEFYYEMSIKCHDQNSGHSKNHDEIFMFHY